MTTTAAPARTTSTGIGRTLLVGLIAGLVAGVANVVVYLIGQALGVPFQIPMQGPGSPIQQLPIVAPVISSTIPGVGAGLLYWALGRFTRKATTIFVAISVVFGLLSLFPSMSLPVELSTRLALSLMHVVAAPIIVLGLIRNAPQQ